MTDETRIAALLAMTTTANNLASEPGITRSASQKLITIMRRLRQLRELIYAGQFCVSERADTEPVTESDIVQETDND